MKALDVGTFGRRVPSGDLRTAAATLLGLFGGAGVAVIAWWLGPAAVLALLLAFGLVLWHLGASVERIADGCPRAVALEPLPPRPRLVGDDANEAEVQQAPPDEGQREGSAPPRVRRVADPWLGGMVELPGGEFWMGSDKSLDPDAYENELPRRRVRVSPFAIGVTPVTRGQWRRVMAQARPPWARSVPREWVDGGDDLPATHVSWFDCLAFCNALSVLSGRSPCYQEAGGDWTCDWTADGYRLPTEAEWEYACRAGTETRWFWGDDARDFGDYASDSGNSGYALQPVRAKKSNAFLLHDMAGNCWEWCWDRYGQYDEGRLEHPHGPGYGSTRARVLRGGPFDAEPRDLRSARRHGNEPWIRFDNIGFRCVRSVRRP